MDLRLLTIVVDFFDGPRPHRRVQLVRRLAREPGLEALGVGDVMMRLSALGWIEQVRMCRYDPMARRVMEDICLRPRPKLDPADLRAGAADR
jgi:hypothetical protein